MVAALEIGGPYEAISVETNPQKARLGKCRAGAGEAETWFAVDRERRSPLNGSRRRSTPYRSQERRRIACRIFMLS